MKSLVRNATSRLPELTWVLLSVLTIDIATGGCDRAGTSVDEEGLLQNSSVNQTTTISQETETTLPAGPADLDALIATHGYASFLSYNDQWHGTDIDTSIRFLPENNILLQQFQDRIVEYEGTYTIEDDGRLALSIPKLDNRWPTMMLRKDAKSLLLKPIEQDDLPQPSWPYRSVDPYVAQNLFEEVILTSVMHYEFRGMWPNAKSDLQAIAVLLGIDLQFIESTVQLSFNVVDDGQLQLSVTTREMEVNFLLSPPSVEDGSLDLSIEAEVRPIDSPSVQPQRMPLFQLFKDPL